MLLDVVRMSISMLSRRTYDGDIDGLDIRLMAALEGYLLVLCCGKCAARECCAAKNIKLHRSGRL